uniref:Dynamin-type G domain-containing protein n=1 Tax=Alexandrium catenella TaxID=2925 RepID=A0A7S1S483_ALECA|mmetsp:Transcript_85499/g.227133  ORF Transcript_85499/g.227133 Transcript_85499/m.227133 type:complete len:478 (+) Transcript_85499:51-1484(+)
MKAESASNPPGPPDAAGAAMPDAARASGGSSSSGRSPCEEPESVWQRHALRRLWQIYEETVLPIELRSHFAHFHSPRITPEEFSSRPQVLLLGQYSTGKTSMVRWLTGQECPHFDVRPQPSTDKFMAVVHGEQERLINGNAATCLPQLPYQGLSVFGSSFLGSFQALALPSEILQELTFIDTPGVLAGSKQRISRGYDFAEVCAWMAERADVVLLTFDAHKLDISDEFQQVMEVLRPYANKVRCVLNKADQIDAANLVRVYGALLWNVGKVFRTPEVTRVFVSSFWEEEYRFQDHKQLFDEDKQAVLKELHDLPRTSLLRKINNFVGRVRRVRAHLAIASHVRSQMPWFLVAFGLDARLRRWLDANLPRLFEETQRLRGLSAGDMPSFEAFKTRLFMFEDLSRLPSWDARAMARLNRVIDMEVPAIINRVGGVSAPEESWVEAEDGGPSKRKGLLSLLGFGEDGEGDRCSKRRRLSA